MTIHKHTFSYFLAILCTTCLSASTFAQNTIVVDFDDVDIPGPNMFITGGNLPSDFGPDDPVPSFSSGGVTFEGGLVAGSTFNGQEFVDSTLGFFLSNVTVNQDLAIAPGVELAFIENEQEFILHQLSAFVPETDGATSNFAVLSLFDLNFAPTVPRTALLGHISAPIGASFESIEVTNTTYAANSLRFNTSGNFTTAFEDLDDLFTLFIVGLRDGQVTGEVEFTLAQGTGLGDESTPELRVDIVDEFTTISLAELGDATEIAFQLASTDFIDFGTSGAFINTPSFVAIDNLTFSTVPEPGNLLICLLANAGLFVRRRSRA